MIIHVYFQHGAISHDPGPVILKRKTRNVSQVNFMYINIYMSANNKKSVNDIIAITNDLKDIEMSIENKIINIKNQTEEIKVMLEKSIDNYYTIIKNLDEH